MTKRIHTTPARLSRCTLPSCAVVGHSVAQTPLAADHDVPVRAGRRRPQGSSAATELSPQSAGPQARSPLPALRNCAFRTLWFRLMRAAPCVPSAMDCTATRHPRAMCAHCTGWASTWCGRQCLESSSRKRGAGVCAACIGTSNGRVLPIPYWPCRRSRVRPLALWPRAADRSGLDLLRRRHFSASRASPAE